MQSIFKYIKKNIYRLKIIIVQKAMHVIAGCRIATITATLYSNRVPSG